MTEQDFRQIVHNLSPRFVEKAKESFVLLGGKSGTSPAYILFLGFFPSLAGSKVVTCHESSCVMMSHASPATSAASGTFAPVCVRVPYLTGAFSRCRSERSGGAETGQHPQQGIRALEAPHGTRQAEWHPVPWRPCEHGPDRALLPRWGVPGTPQPVDRAAGGQHLGYHDFRGSTGIDTAARHGRVLQVPR
jgi:hypothetical protein